jgi:hypothetical protein
MSEEIQMLREALTGIRARAFARLEAILYNNSAQSDCVRDMLWIDRECRLALKSEPRPERTEGN